MTAVDQMLTVSMNRNERAPMIVPTITATNRIIHSIKFTANGCSVLIYPAIIGLDITVRKNPTDIACTLIPKFLFLIAT